MARRPKLSVAQTHQAMKDATRSHAIIEREYQLKFRPAKLDAKLLPQLRVRAQTHRYFWNKLDGYFRNLPWADFGINPWKGLPYMEGATGTREALFHSCPDNMSILVSQANVRTIYAQRNAWWTRDDPRLDNSLVLFTYIISKYLRKRFPEHPGKFTEFGSTPLRLLDHEVPFKNHAFTATAPDWLTSPITRADFGDPVFPIPATLYLNGRYQDTYMVYADDIPLRDYPDGLQTVSMRIKPPTTA